MSALWRTRQFEYTWLRTIGRQYVDFWRVTEEALIFSCKSLKLELTKVDQDRLMQSYVELKAWPDAPAALKGLKESGLRLAFLSNFTVAMLDGAVKNSGLEGIFDDHLSTDRVRADPRHLAPGQPEFRAEPSRHIGPLIPPSLRTRQKWIMIKSAAASGIATQCRT